jgi:hypothetical protein
MKALCIEALTIASKFIAHFTQKGATISAARLRLYGTSKLVREFFYSATGTPAPTEIVNSEIQPKPLSCWDLVETQYML